MSILPQLSLFDEKRCNDCLQWKPLTNFKKRGNRAGYIHVCNPCAKARNKIAMAKYKAAHLENHLKRDRENKRRLREDADYMQKCRDSSRNYAKANPDKIRANNTHNSSVRRARELQAEGSHTHQEWIELLRRYRWRCLCCGRPCPSKNCRDKKKLLTRDHIVPLSRGGTNYIWNIQPLCYMCNCRKHDKHINYRPDRLLLGE